MCPAALTRVADGDTLPTFREVLEQEAEGVNTRCKESTGRPPRNRQKETWR